MVIRPKTVFTLALYPFVVAAALYLLAFGLAVLHGITTRPVLGFWKVEKFFYGVLPIFATPAILAVTFRRWARVYVRRRNAWLAACVVAVFAAALDSIVFSKFHGPQDERIRVAWQQELGLFSWGTGEIKVPVGFTYARETGIDTFMGRFTSKDGRHG